MTYRNPDENELDRDGELLEEIDRKLELLLERITELLDERLARRRDGDDDEESED